MPRGRPKKEHVDVDPDRFREIVREGMGIVGLTRADLQRRANRQRLYRALSERGYSEAFVARWQRRLDEATDPWHHALEDRGRPLPLETARVLFLLTVVARPRLGSALGELPATHRFWRTIQSIPPENRPWYFVRIHRGQPHALIPPASQRALAAALAEAAMGALPTLSGRTRASRRADLEDAFTGFFRAHGDEMADGLFFWDEWIDLGPRRPAAWPPGPQLRRMTGGQYIAWRRRAYGFRPAT